MPWSQVHLVSTTWEVRLIGDQRPAGEALPTIRFEADNRISISTDCGTLVGKFSGDTDGDALTFWGLDGPTPSASAAVITPTPRCPTANQDLALVQALLAVDEWSVTSDDEIVLHGRPDLELHRISPP
jgi:hypothetical protein